MTVQDLIGGWKLLSWTRKVLASGKEADAFGPRPVGFLNYAPDGRMMVLVVRSDRKVPAEIPPADHEKVSLFESMLAYAGTYALDNDQVFHNLDVSWNQTWTGLRQARFCKTDGRRLVLTTPNLKDPMDGKDSIHILVWEKVS
jgi:hypothetical protein